MFVIEIIRKVLIRVTKISAFRFYEEFTNILRRKNIKENQDYNHISNEKLRTILNEIKEVLFNVYNQEKPCHQDVGTVQN